MKYLSTRTSAAGSAETARPVSPSEAVLQGIAPDGGLFAPQYFPNVADQLEEWKNLPYEELAARILGLYFDDFSKEELQECTRAAYLSKFPSGIVPVRRVHDNVNMIELWHGPTLAFKDMALQVLPRLLTSAMKKTGETKDMLILVATSGDTGKAALEGFADVDHTAIAVFYPKDGVSNAQKLQMVTQTGKNVHVCAVEGNFDDAQTGVKSIFGDTDFQAIMAEKNFRLSSANSINWGRLAPQIAYYFWAYFKMLEDGQVTMGEPINIVVPTGNFGNILAAYYAKQMGLPVKRFICASNSNKVLADFFADGTYNSLREFYRTMSPSMDILISSNLERLLFEAAGRDGDQVADLMAALKSGGSFQISNAMREMLAKEFWGGWMSEEETAEEIGRVYREHGYVMDPHTAVGHGVYRRYLEKTGDSTPVAIASTASPYKFAQNVLRSMGETANNEEEACERLSQLSGLPVPPQISELQKKPVLHRDDCAKDKMREDILHWIDGYVR